jgi:LexA-binding, inner membrane-associated putative hydrolase
MANFTTHIAVGTVVSGALATLTLAANVIPHESLVAVTLAGVLGSVLPDIDLKDSRPSRAMFAGLGIFFSFAVLFSCAGRFSIVELWILWLGTLVGVRYGLHAIFHRIAVHRGVWHSLLATVFVALLTSLVFKYILGEPDGVAWLAAGFMAIGYLTHLTLDELYSVDVMDTRLKASFGTALKLADLHHWRHSAAMAVCTVGLALIAPPVKGFIAGLSSQTMWAGLQQKLLPHETWFGLIEVRRHVAVAPTTEGTGAIPPGPVRVVAAQPPAAPEPLVTGSLPSRTPFRTIASDGAAAEPAAR